MVLVLKKGASKKEIAQLEKKLGQINGVVCKLADTLHLK
jgi:hypothetical protein